MLCIISFRALSQLHVWSTCDAMHLHKPPALTLRLQFICAVYAAEPMPSAQDTIWITRLTSLVCTTSLFLPVIH
jgi:hypothetical protein